MSATATFRTEFKGYNKKEVVEYISSLNSQLEGLKAELDRTESELKKCKAELEEYENQNLQNDAEKVDAEAIYAEAYEKAREEFAAKTDDAELAELRAKAEMYESQKDLIAEIVIKAKSDAHEIRTAAEEKSKDLLVSTFEKFEKAREDFIQMRKNVEAGKAELDARIAAVSHYLNDFTQYLNILEKDVVNTGENFKDNL